MKRALARAWLLAAMNVGLLAPVAAQTAAAAKPAATPKAYLTKINPIVDPALDASGVLTFGNAAVQHGLAKAPTGYTAAWHTFDNVSGASKPLGQTRGTQGRIQAPSGLPTSTGAYIRVDVSADHPEHPKWKDPVRAYFLRQAAGWKLVGLERMREGK